jgi:hypothetical protein
MSRFWRLLETGLRFCAHTGGVQGQEGCGGPGSCGSGWDRAVFLDFLDFAGAFWLYLTSFVKYWIGYWIYEIYVDLLIAE